MSGPARAAGVAVRWSAAVAAGRRLAGRRGHPASRTPRSSSPAGWWSHDGLFVTTNDSGDTGRVFVVDPATGDDRRRDALVRRTRPTSRRWPRRGHGDGLGRRHRRQPRRAAPTSTVARVPVGRGRPRRRRDVVRAGLPRRAARRRDPAGRPARPAGCTSSPRASSAATLYAAPAAAARRPAQPARPRSARCCRSRPTAAFFPDGRH